MQIVTINGECYPAMLVDWFSTEIEAEDMDQSKVQQNEAYYHTIDILHPEFENRMISRNGNMNSPSQSCSFNVIELFSLKNSE